MQDSLYNYIYLLGIEFVRQTKRILKRSGRIIVHPFLAIGAAFIIIYKAVDKFLLNTFHDVFDEAKVLMCEAKGTAGAFRLIWKRDKKSMPSCFAYYVKKAYKRHRNVFVYTVNTVLPIFAFLLLVATIRYMSNTTFALEVSYKNQTLGYVSNEEAYLAAQNQAKERLDIGAFNEDDDTISKASYALKTVNLNSLNDSATICDRLIENSDSKITNACGIYIDGNFLCAVKNETDAISVFDKLLEPYESNEKNATVGFVENVQYVQGLYPDNESTIWGADLLQKRLNTTKTEAQYYSVQSGDTLSGIADKFDIKTRELYALNSGLSETIHVGQKLLISSEVNYLRVKVTKTEKRTVSVAYKTIKVNNSSLYTGTSRTITKGVNGSQVVTELISYVDGVKTSVQEISRVTTKEAVNEKIEVGTKTRYYSSYSGIGSTTKYGRMVWPCVGATVISSPYGYRSRGFHSGVDLCRPGGTYGAMIVAADSGTVTTATYHSSYGYYIIINHGNGISTLYAHCSKLRVSVGQHVSAGQVIAAAGSTGNSTGAHCHFEVRVNGRTVNPMSYLR